MSETVIRGTVGDVISREEVGRHIVPDAVHHHIHEGEELAKIVPDGQGDHPIYRLDSIAVVGWAVASFVHAITPRSWHPEPTPLVIAPAGTFDGNTGRQEIVVEPVVDPDVPAADGGQIVYRFVDGLPTAARERVDWPTPSFDRPGVSYCCFRCGEFVNPSEGDKEAGLLQAAATTKLCGECAEAIEDAIAKGDPLPPEKADLDLVEEWPDCHRVSRGGSGE